MLRQEDINNLFIMTSLQFKICLENIRTIFLRTLFLVHIINVLIYKTGIQIFKFSVRIVHYKCLISLSWIHFYHFRTQTISFHGNGYQLSKSAGIYSSWCNSCASVSNWTRNWWTKNSVEGNKNRNLIENVSYMSFHNLLENKINLNLIIKCRAIEKEWWQH